MNIGPSIRIRQIQPIGQQPQLCYLAISVGDPDDHQPHGLAQMILVMGCPQPGDHDIADHPRFSCRLIQRSFFQRDERGVVFDPAHQRRFRLHDLRKEFVTGIATIQDIQPSRLQGPGQLCRLLYGLISSGLAELHKHILLMQMQQPMRCVSHDGRPSVAVRQRPTRRLP